MYPIYNHSWRNISTIYVRKETSIKQNILTIKKYIGKSVGLRTYQQPCIFVITKLVAYLLAPKIFICLPLAAVVSQINPIGNFLYIFL